jgi:glycosyltransferase involved in cell wall biosynthesis
LSYHRNDSRLKIIAQSGLGIYSAMNEGIKQAEAKYMWFMNAGDTFAKESVLESALRKVNEYQVGVVIGCYQVLTENTIKTYSHQNMGLSELKFAFGRRDRHEAMIFASDIVKQLGGYKTEISLASDFDFILRVIRTAGARRVSEVYALVESGGVSDRNLVEVHRQKHKIRKDFFGRKLISAGSTLWTIAAKIKVNLKRCVSIS